MSHSVKTVAVLAAAFGCGPWFGATEAGAQGVQVPPIVRQQAAEIQDHFQSVLEEECPSASCYSVGCKVSRFDTLDQSQSSSLPGLEQEGVEAKPQYRLASVLCEFAYEPTLPAEDLNNIRQRVRQKVKTVGVDVQLSSRELQPKAVEALKPTPAPTPPPLPMTWREALWTRMLPFLPWFLGATLLTAAAMLLIWAARRLGRKVPAPIVETAAGKAGSSLPAAVPPTPYMLLTRVSQLRQDLSTDKRLVELSLRDHFEHKRFDELCIFLRQFGPELLQPFKEKAEYREALGALSRHYAEHPVSDDPAETWRFFDRLEREITAAKVRIDSEPLSEDFNFLAALEVDEFVGILRDFTDEEAIAAVSYAPRRLRERFFALANPGFTAKFVERLSTVEKMPDSFVRGVAQKLRSIYTEKGDTLKTIRVDKLPLLEEALNALDPVKRRQVIADLGRDHPDFAQKMAPAMFLDDSLPYLPDGLLTEAMLVCSPEEAGHYLGAYPWGKAVLAKLSPRLAAAIAPHLTKPTEDEDLVGRSGREKVAAFVKKLHAQGALDLSQLNAKLAQAQT